MVDAVGTTAYSYDNVGQLLSEGGLWPDDTVSYTYNNQLRTELNLLQPNASAWSQSYSYDSARRLTSITSPAGTFGYNYDPAKELEMLKLTLSNGAYITNSYDSVARLLGTTLDNSGNTSLDSYTYTYNQAGQRIEVVRTAGDYVNYTYDNIGELQTALGKESGGVTNRWQEQFGYAYDAAGNLNERTNNALLQTFYVNNLNELTATTNAGQLTVAGTTTKPGHERDGQYVQCGVVCRRHVCQHEPAVGDRQQHVHGDCQRCLWTPEHQQPHGQPPGNERLQL